MLYLIPITLCVSDHEPQTKLPEIWRAAYTPDDPKAEPKPFDLWGIQIDPSAPSKDARVSVLLMKFLRARYGLPIVCRPSTERDGFLGS